MLVTADKMDTLPATPEFLLALSPLLLTFAPPSTYRTCLSGSLPIWWDLPPHQIHSVSYESPPSTFGDLQLSVAEHY